MNKHPAYIEEKEWRIFIKNNYNVPYSWLRDKGMEPQIHYGSKDGFVYPYINFNVPNSFIKRITIGPCAEQKLNLYSISEFISTQGDIGDYKINLSTVPYLKR